MVLLAIPFGLAIGVALGMLGGGGSVLAVPVFVYVLDQTVHEATTASLVVVAAAALAGGAMQARGQRVCWPQAATFVPGALAGTIAGTALNQAAGGELLLAGFAAVMVVAAVFTWRKADAPDDPPAEGSCPQLRFGRTLGAGLVVGVLTGFFGVGGGFLVVPLLALALRFPFRQAIGTSLVIVAVVSIFGLIAHLVAGGEIEADVTAAMAGACVAGAIAGALFAQRVPQRTLGRGFALLVMGVALYLFAETLLFGGPPNG